MTFSSPYSHVSSQSEDAHEVISGVGSTKLSNTHLFSGLSHFRHCHICWLLFSRHSQCFRNSCRQCLLTSASLYEEYQRRCSVDSCVTAVGGASIHAGSTSCDLPSLFHAIHFTGAIGIRLTLHEVVIIWLTAGTDKKGGAHQRSRAGADFCDFGDVIGERSCVDEDVLVESGLPCQRKCSSGQVEAVFLTSAAGSPCRLRLTAPGVGGGAREGGALALQSERRRGTMIWPGLLGQDKTAFDSRQTIQTVKPRPPQASSYRHVFTLLVLPPNL